VGYLVSPPSFDSLVTTARKRARRARIVTAAATFSFLAAVGVGLALVHGDGDDAIRPAHLPSLGPATPTGGDSALNGVLPLPATPEGQEPQPLDAGRYHVPLGHSVAFEVDLPQGTTSNSDGLYLQSRPNILKVELAGTSYGVPSDPCRAQYVEPVGGTVQDLVRAIRHEPVYRVSRPEPVTIDGVSGTHLQIGIPAGYDSTSCESSEVGLPGNPDSSNNMPPGYVADWWILNVHGHRVVAQEICDGCTAEQRNRVARQVKTMTFPTKQ